MSKTKFELKDFIKLSNMITSVRILTIPLMFYFAYEGERVLSLVFLFVSWLIDFIDGAIARKHNQETKLGYYLDTYLDGVFLIGIIFYVYMHYNSIFLKYYSALIILSLMFLINCIFSLLKFKEIYSLHLWSGKVLGNTLALFFITTLWNPDIILLDAVIFLRFLYEIETFFIILKPQKVDQNILTILDPKGKKLKEFKTNMKILANKITFIRFIALPILLYLAYKQQILWFTAVFYIAAISDQLDGIAARRLNQSSKYGSNMDSLADEIYYPFGILCFYLIKPEIFTTAVIITSPVFALYIIDRIIFYTRFKNAEKLHLYSGKAFQKYFFICYPLVFFSSNYRLILIIMTILGCIVVIEELFIYFNNKKLPSGIKTFIKKENNPFYYLYRVWP